MSNEPGYHGVVLLPGVILLPTKSRCLFLLLGLLFLVARAEAKPLPATYCRLASQAHVEGAAIAVFENGAFSAIGCGKRDSAQRQPVTPETVFEAASLGKPVFAYAVLKLAQDGRLDLNVPLLKYLDNRYVHEEDPFFRRGGTDEVRDPRLQRTTAREVLSHTTGLPNWATSGPLFFTGQPGTWQYSAEGYILLQRVVERITGQPLDKWMQKTVFEPLDMRHSSFVWNPAFHPIAAIGFDRSGNPEGVHAYPHALAPATLYTTLDDYGLFLQRLLDGDAIGRRMMQEQTVVDKGYGLAWGLGIGIEEREPPLAYFHSGNNHGYRAFFLIEPEKRQGLLFLTNSDNGYRLVKPFMALAMPDRHPVLDAPELPYPK
jgi:CubicO group peptidase (beta-lactamase class C family)